MDKIELIGVIEEDGIKLVERSNDPDIITISLIVEKVADEGIVSQNHMLATWGHISQIVNDILKPGDKIKVLGELKTESFDQKGEEVSVTVVWIHEFSIVKGFDSDS